MSTTDASRLEVGRGGGRGRRERGGLRHDIRNARTLRRGLPCLAEYWLHPLINCDFQHYSDLSSLTPRVLTKQLFLVPVSTDQHFVFQLLSIYCEGEDEKKLS